LNPSNRVQLPAVGSGAVHVWTLINGGPENAPYKSTDSCSQTGSEGDRSA